jgi:hypothetical protein
MDLQTKVMYQEPPMLKAISAMHRSKFATLTSVMMITAARLLKSYWCGYKPSNSTTCTSGRQRSLFYSMFWGWIEVDLLAGCHRTRYLLCACRGEL